jgi:hypothetical protein
MFQKKHMMMMKKDDMKYEREVKLAAAKVKLADKYANKVESKLHVETKAMAEKKRTKFDPEVDEKGSAMTMGGFLPTQGMRAVP